MKTLHTSIPTRDHNKLLNANRNILFVEKDCNLRFIKANEKWLQFGNFKNINHARGLTDKDCVWGEFADIYEKHDKDILTNKAYGSVQPSIVENRRYCFLHNYKWPKYDYKGNIIGIKTFSYEVSNHTTIDAIYLLTNRNQIDIKKYNNDKTTYDLLTKQEKKILFYICHNKPVSKIAPLLNIPNKNIEMYFYNIKHKLKCRTKRQLIEFAITNFYIYIFPDWLLKKSLASIGIKTGLYLFLSAILDE